MESRLARSNAEESVTRSLQEPKAYRFDPDLAEGLLAAADNISLSVLALEAYLRDNPSRHALPEVTTFTNSVDKALYLLTRAIREGEAVTTFPDLQQALRTLEHAGHKDKHKAIEARPDLRFVIAEARRIVRNIETMRQLLSTTQVEDAS